MTPALIASLQTVWPNESAQTIAAMTPEEAITALIATVNELDDSLNATENDRRAFHFWA